LLVGVFVSCGGPSGGSLAYLREQAERAEKEETAMIRIGGGIAFILVATNLSFAQDYCEQVKQGIAQYGYAAARQYAVEHYTKEEVRAADRCVVKLRLREATASAPR
jgi:hypothetical protein